MTIDEAYVEYRKIYDYAEIGVEFEALVDVEEFQKSPCAGLYRGS